MYYSSCMTKIVCTIGPASESPAVLRDMILSGMSVARLNFSHGSPDEHANKIRLVRDISRELGRPVAILQDLAGPKIRVGHIPDPGIMIKTGSTFILTTRILEGNDNMVSVTDPNLHKVVSSGDTILLADGLMELRVLNAKDQDIYCEVINGGLLTSGKGINLPTNTVLMPSMTQKDYDDLEIGLKNDVDYVALSFVRSADDIKNLKAMIEKKGKKTPVIAKIEKHEAIANIEKILEVSDGIMVARGDLGVEIPLESVPVIQKKLIEMANKAGKPVITATQMLRSMVDSARPTRAEAGDVANAVLDGTDAIMLSEETAIGNYPVKSVEFMSRISKKAEEIYPHERYSAMGPDNMVSESVAHSASVLAANLGAAAIIAPTRSGLTAARISRFRPECPIIALSPGEETVRRITLLWGCLPYLVDELGEEDNIIRKSADAALKKGLLNKGDLAVITAGDLKKEPGNTTRIEVIKI